MNVNNCRMHEHLASSGKVKTQQDSKSCCFRNSGLPGDRGKDTAAVWTPLFIKARWIHRLHRSTRSPPHRTSSSVSSMSTALHQQELCEKLIFNSVMSGCLFSPPPMVSMLFHYQICFRIFFSPPSSECCQLQGQRCPLKSHPEVTMSKWVTSVGHEKESEGERNSGGECVCSCSMVCRVQNWFKASGHRKRAALHSRHVPETSSRGSTLPLSSLHCRHLNESVLSCNAQHGSPPLTQLL